MKKLTAALLAGVFATLVACSGPPLPFTSSEPKDVAIQEGDLKGLQKCKESGSISDFLKSAQGENPDTYKAEQQAWKKLQDGGATDGWVQVLSNTPKECTSLFGVGTAPQQNPKVASSFVFKYRDESSAVKAFNRGDFGVSPASVKGQNGVSEGAATGLGNNSVVFSQSFGNQSSYLALWQNKQFGVLLFTVNVATQDAKKAAGNMNSRVH